MLVFTIIVKAQQPHEQTIRNAANLKSGNSQDVLTSFYQLALSDLLGNQKSFDFSTSLLAIKAKTNPNLWKSMQYKQHKLDRNLVLSMQIQLDSGYNFRSSTLGASYAIVNKRDQTIFEFSLDREKEWNEIVYKSLNNYAKSLPLGVQDPKYKAASNFFNDEASTIQTSLENLPPDFADSLTNFINQYAFFKGIGLRKFQQHLQNSYDSLANTLANQPLWTVNAKLANAANGKLLTGVVLHTEYLQGLLKNNGSSGLELNVNSNVNFLDNLQTIEQDLKRRVWSSSLGFNWILASNSNQKSVLEFKGALSHHYVFSGKLSDEKTQSVTGEGNLRIRLTDQLWIPFQIAYDPQTGNTLARISIRSNFDWLKKNIVLD